MTDRRKTPKSTVFLGRRETDISLGTELKRLNEVFKQHELSDSNNFDKFHLTLGDIGETVKNSSDELKEYIIADMKWKKDNQEALDNMRNITGLTKFGLGAVVTVGTLLAGIGAIKNYFH